MAFLWDLAEQFLAPIVGRFTSHVKLVVGVEDDIRSLANELKTIRNFLDDAENRRFKDKNINRWLSRLEQTSREVEDVLDEWNYASIKLQVEEDHRSDDGPPNKKVRFLPSSSSLGIDRAAVRYDIARKIRDVKAQLDKIFEEKDRYGFVISQPTADPLPVSSWRIQSTSWIDTGKVHGRDRDKGLLVTKLTAINGGSQEESGIEVVSIVGMGGIGKTTLAQLVYNHSRVEKSFDLRIWICVSDPFDMAAIAKGILESIKMGSSPDTNQQDVLFNLVRESVSGKRFLLVLDDVWTEDYNKWEPLDICLRCGGAIGSKILVTTRNERVAIIMGTKNNDIHRPGQLSNEDCWLVLHHTALFGRNNLLELEKFEEIGKKIVEKCNGLPLAAKTLGSVLRFKKNVEDWENVLKSKIWEMEETEVELFPHLLLSYNELSPTLKHCFSYCAFFPKDFRIFVKDLIENWMALGYFGSNNGDMELKGQECFDVLAMRSLFQDFEKDNFDEIYSCKMHDIVHDFAQFLRKSDRVDAAGTNKTTCRQGCDPSLVSFVKEFCSLYWDKNYPPNICDCLARLRVLCLKNRGLQTFPQGMERLIHLRRLELLGIYRLSCEDIKIIFQLYNLQTLKFYCAFEELPSEIGNLTQLRHLDLSRNGSLKELPSEIGNLTQLRHIDLSRNGSLKELPSEIGNLTRLRHLDLSWNGSLKELPSEIGNLTQLRHLALSWNSSLKELPSEIGNLTQLRHLDLSENGCLKELPSEIGKLTQLRRLNLSGNGSLKELPSEIRNLTRLRDLGLSGNGSLKELPSEIGNLTLLRDLDLSRNGSLKELPSEIGNLTQLLHLNLSGNGSLKELPSEIGNLTQLGHLNLSGNGSLKELPSEIGNLTQLGHLDLSGNGSLKELPSEIGNLTQLLYLNLSGNGSLKELPSEVGNLTQLRHLDLSGNGSLKELPESICGLQELQTLNVFLCKSICRLPEGLAQLTGLRSLNEFKGGSGWSKLGLLKKLNHLGGNLKLEIRLSGDDNLKEVVEDAREAKLSDKIHIKTLEIAFGQDEMDENELSTRVRMDVIDALQPHPNLVKLLIYSYKGSKLPLWMVSPFNQLSMLRLSNCGHLTSLPSLGKLPNLENINIDRMTGLEILGQAFLGITRGGGGGGQEVLNIQSSSNTNLLIAFPKLNELSFHHCDGWKEWEDITAEEEESSALSIMPCLNELIITSCDGLTALPHRLLRKASSLEELNISKSTKLQERYGDKDGSDWKSISQNNPHLRLINVSR